MRKGLNSLTDKNSYIFQSGDNHKQRLFISKFRHFNQVLSASKYINKTETQVLKTPNIYDKFCNIHKLYKLYYVCNVFLIAISHIKSACIDEDAQG
jgi:hypothetical protein